MTALVDHAERERIRTSLDETLVVEAAAGTGKTSALVARLVNVLAEGRGDVQSIAALTFTEKAAGELKLRLRAGLEEARQRAETGGARHRRLEEAIAHLEEARVSTIHGFCNDLLHERPVEARVDPGFDVLPEPEAEALYRRAFDGWLAETLEAPPEGLRRALRRRSFDGDPVDRLRRAGWQLVGWRDFRAPWQRRAFDRAAAIETLVARVHVLYEELRTCSTTADTLYADLWPLRRLSEDVRTRESVAPRDLDWLEAALVDLRRERSFKSPRRGNTRNYRGVTRDAVLATHADLLAALEAFAREADAELAALVQQSLLETVDRYEALKSRAAALDFVDLLLRARDLVRDRGEVRADLQRRLTHVFVDEFQDTDPLQAEIVLLLSASDPSVDRWQDVTPAPGKLFVVGDPKQSIYRFRRADVGTYQAVKDLLVTRGAACVYLTTSFRATPSIQRLVNAAFAPAMREDRAALQAAYVPLAPYREERLDQPGLVALPVPKPYGRYGGFTKVAVDESLPDAVGAFVGWLLKESGFTVSERERPGEALPISARHVCLLFRRFTTWGRDVTRDYVEALEARGISHLLVGGRSFHLREEVESLRTALAAIEWPDDELSVYATLKGPLFAVGDEELVEWRQRFRRLHPYRLPKQEVGASLRPVVEALALLRSLHGLRNYRPVEETINRLLAATRAHAAFVLRPRGEQALANVLRVAELARTYEAGGSISFRGFVERLREEAEGESPEAPIVEESSEGVRIMTVHRAKGLEFPVVILADITAGITGNPGRYVDPERGLCALRLGGWQPWDLLDHEEEEAGRDRAEGVRVAYVAATRARDLLVVPAVGDDPSVAGWEAASDGWVSPVHAAVYPPAERRRASTDAPGCPSFGEDSVLERPDRDTPGRDNVRPGLHSFGDADARYDVAWWDPRRLVLDVQRVYGLRREDLIQDPGREIVEADRRRYDEWLASRQDAQERGARPSLRVRTVTDWASTTPESDESAGLAGDVEVIAAAAGVARPGGPRFGTLVHAALATVALDAGTPEVAEAVSLQARIVGAPPDEVEAATRLVSTALEHPLLVRARDAWREGRCRRESPLAFSAADGSQVEGVLDLAFEDDAGWTVVDFKTDAELAGGLARYRRQVALYASIVARATAKPVTAVLLQL
ncbi:MAG TPA: UvrD-helicase domain-containing protein [Candidatus Acidoferrum sp.]|nr:UvrD-helicase domain-containing protein [Candidatus Acidoferrum sp.]